jgi:hypothetical protein
MFRACLSVRTIRSHLSIQGGDHEILPLFSVEEPSYQSFVFATTIQSGFSTFLFFVLIVLMSMVALTVEFAEVIGQSVVFKLDIKFQSHLAGLIEN